MLITSVNNETIKELVKLKDKKYRDMNNLFFVEGEDLIKEAYKNKLLKHIYLLSDAPNLYDDIPCTYVNDSVMKKISDMESISNYFGVCQKKTEDKIGDRLLVLDDIQDPGNLGTIIRSAVAFNFDTIVLSTGTVDVYNPKVVRSSKGMLFNVNMIVRDLPTFLEELEDITIYGTDVTKGTDIRGENIPKKIALVIGNEGKGISDKVREKCQKFIYIDMNEKCESLNAGVSAAILMYEVNKK